MSRSSNADEAVQRVKDAFDSATEEAEQISEAAKEVFREAIDELEATVGDSESDGRRTGRASRCCRPDSCSHFGR